MSVSKRVLTLFASVVVLAAAVAAGAATLAGPSLPAMALAPADLGPGTKASGQRSSRPVGFEAGYHRTLVGRGGLYGRSRIVLVDMDLLLARTLDDAKQEFGASRRDFARPSTRREIAQAFAQGLRSEVGKKNFLGTRVGGLRSSRIGEASFTFPIVLRTREGNVRVTITYLRVDRALELAIVVGAPLYDGDSDRLLRVGATRMGGQFVPAVTAPPVITGAPQEGQQLTATTGTWTGAAPTFTYQWSRCDATGNACADIPGATASTYVATTVDVTFTLKVTVTAQNAYGSATSASVPTPVVAPITPPPAP